MATEGEAAAAVNLVVDAEEKDKTEVKVRLFMLYKSPLA